MKPILSAVILLIAASTALPAFAQNAGQIARVRGGASCAGCNLFQGDFSGLSARGLNLNGARLRDVDAYGGVFSGASFAGADLTNASFVGAYLDGANFQGATLSGANFAGASLERARGLSQARLNQACGDEATRLPPGLRIPHC